MHLQGPAAHYDEDLNVLTVPANLMVFPHHVPGAPLWVTVAGLGWHVLHKVFHIYDSVHLTSLLADFRRIGHWESTTWDQYKVRGSSFRDSNIHKQGCKRFFTSHIPLKENQMCFKDAYSWIKDYYPRDTNYTEEAIIDNAALSVTAQTFEFLERQIGRWNLGTDTGWTFPALYYVATVKPFCYTFYRYSNQRQNNLFSRWRVNYSIRDVLKHFPEGFQCTGRTFMKRRQCEFWEKV